jgi:hypothetical protein
MHNKHLLEQKGVENFEYERFEKVYINRIVIVFSPGRKSVDKVVFIFNLFCISFYLLLEFFHSCV